MKAMFDLVSAVACVLSIAGKVAVNRKHRANFILFICSYAAWIVFNITNTPNIPQIIQYAVYTILSVIGWVKWSKEMKHMCCPVCGGTIHIDESKDFGECDTCMTYYYEGRVYPDHDIIEEDTL